MKLARLWCRAAKGIVHNSKAGNALACSRHDVPCEIPGRSVSWFSIPMHLAVHFDDLLHHAMYGHAVCECHRGALDKLALDAHPKPPVGILVTGRLEPLSHAVGNQLINVLRLVAGH